MDPIYALKQLRPYVSHFHFKIIELRSQLAVFAPNNVYAAEGSRERMISLFEVAVDYRMFLREEAADMIEMEASLKWFGPNVKDILAKDSKEIHRVLQVEKER